MAVTSDYMVVTRKYTPNEPISAEALCNELESLGWAPTIGPYNGREDQFKLVYDDNKNDENPSIGALLYLRDNGNLGPPKLKKIDIFA